MLQSILNTLQQVDTNLYLSVYQLRQPWLNSIMPVITHLGTWGVLWLAWALWLFLFGAERGRQVAVLTVVTLAFSFLLADLVVKDLVTRTRPYLALEGVIPLVEPLKSTSFPSGHTTTSFACAVALQQAGGRWRWLPLVLAVLIGLSRVYVGVHYPLDVLAGAVLGILCGVVVCHLPLERIKFTKAVSQ